MTRETLMARDREITIEILRELFDCDFQTGQLMWRARRRDLFPSDQACNAWNAARAGKPALTSVTAHGYRAGEVFKKGVRAHSVVWALHTGTWPAPMLDHINGDTTDNRIHNLRVAPPLVNMKNMGMSVANKSGVVGVYQRGKRWVAYIRANGKPTTLGSFDSREGAVAAREAALVKYGYSEMHGKRPSRTLAQLSASPFSPPADSEREGG